MNKGSVVIRGCGWVTPLGVDVETICDAVGNHEVLEGRVREFHGAGVLEAEVPGEFVQEVARHPRLRRSSPISLYATQAVSRAMSEAGAQGEAGDGMIFASSDGGVEYTCRFFEGIEREGTRAGSPLFFPETVYNAAASHVGAVLGLPGEALSLVGDSAAGLQALDLARMLLLTKSCDRVVVAGAEETNGVSSLGYAAWGLASRGEGLGGAVFSGGAGALVLEREGEGARLEFARTAGFRGAGDGFRKLRELVREACADGGVDLLVVSDSGTRQGRAETRLLRKLLPGIPVLTPRKTLGEGLCASSFWQMIVAVDAVLRRGFQKALVPVFGFHGQVGVAVVSACASPISAKSE